MLCVRCGGGVADFDSAVSLLPCVPAILLFCCRYYFPWAADRLRPDAMPHTNQRREVDSLQRSPLPAETVRLIRQHYHHEMELYDHAVAVHRAQVLRVRTLRAAQPEAQ